MTLHESLNEYREYRDLLESLCQEMYNDLNDGVPSPALRYHFLRESIELVKNEPHPDSTVQNLMMMYLENAFLTNAAKVVVQTLKIPEDD